MARICRRTIQKKKKDFHDLDNHDGVITHLELDILERKVKLAFEGIITNKASGGDGIPASGGDGIPASGGDGIPSS